MPPQPPPSANPTGLEAHFTDVEHLRDAFMDLVAAPMVSNANDISTPHPDTISPIPEGIPLLEAERIARECEPGDGSPQKSAVEKIEEAFNQSALVQPRVHARCCSIRSSAMFRPTTPATLDAENSHCQNPDRVRISFERQPLATTNVNQ